MLHPFSFSPYLNLWDIRKSTLYVFRMVLGVFLEGFLSWRFLRYSDFRGLGFLRCLERELHNAFCLEGYDRSFFSLTVSLKVLQWISSWLYGGLQYSLQSWFFQSHAGSLRDSNNSIPFPNSPREQKRLLAAP